MKSILLFLFLIVSFVFISQTYVYAHGEAGMTMKGSIDGYTGDVDYDNTFVEAGTPGRYVFNLFKGDTIDVAGTGVEFDDLWVRIMLQDGSTNGKMLFAGPILKPNFGGAGMTLTMPQAGDYKILVRYNKDDKKIVEVPYSFTAFSTVVEKEFNFGLEFWSGVGGGFAGALVIGLSVMGVYAVSGKKKVITQ